MCHRINGQSQQGVSARPALPSVATGHFLLRSVAALPPYAKNVGNTRNVMWHKIIMVPHGL
jgi:hypothetical protein